MLNETIAAVDGIAGAMAVVLTACGLFLIFLDVNAPTDRSAARQRLSAFWQRLADVRLSAVLEFVLGDTVRQIDRFVAYWYEQSERNVATAPMVTLIVFVAIPIAALLNWIRGGSPTLFFIMVGCVGAILVLAVLSELKRASIVTKVVSPALFVAIFLIVPIYVFISLTDRTLNMPIGHGALAGVLLAPLLYLICHSAVLIGAGTVAMPVPNVEATVLRRISTLFAAGLPVAFLTVLGGILAWHLLVPEQPVPSNWRTLLVTMAATSLSGASAVYLMSPRRRGTRGLVATSIRLALTFVVGVALVAIVGPAAGLRLEGHAVIAGLPLIAPLIFGFVGFVAILSKGVIAGAQALPTDGPVWERPYRLAGILALLLAVATGWAAYAL